MNTDLQILKADPTYQQAARFWRLGFSDLALRTLDRACALTNTRVPKEWPHTLRDPEAYN